MARTLYWFDGNGDWANPADWGLAPGGSDNTTPTAGDTVIINNGSIVISTADAASFGSIDSESIVLGSGLVDKAPTLDTTGQTLGPNAILGERGDHLYANWIARGLTDVQGAIDVVGNGGQLVLSAVTSGGTVGDVLIDSGGSVNIGLEDGLDFTSGTLTVAGQLTVRGDATIEAGATLATTGTLQLTQDSSFVDLGQVTGNVTFAGPDAVLQIGSLGHLSGTIEGFGATNTVDLTGVVANSATFSAANHGVTLYEGTTAVATVSVAGSFVASSFTVEPDGGTGSNLVENLPAVIKDALPVAIFGTVGQTISLQTILDDAFGSTANFGTVYVSYDSAATLASNQWSYWTTNASLDAVTTWSVPGSNAALTPNSVLGAAVSNFGAATLTIGNDIASSADIKVPVSFSNGTATQYVEYLITVVDPSLQGAASLAHVEPTPMQIVNSASLFDSTYGNAVIPDAEDCESIARDVAAAAGAVHGGNDINPNTSSSETANLNQPDGFWTIAYDAANVVNPGTAWYSLLQPGDIIRLGWNNGRGGITSGHTTTVLSVSPDQQTIELYDNADGGTIGIHMNDPSSPSFWEDSANPNYITVYRLRDDGRYLVNTQSGNEDVYDTTYNDWVQLKGAGDTIFGGAGNELVVGVAADFTGLAMQSAHQNDAFVFSDATSLSASYDNASGELSVNYTTSGNVSSSATIALASGLGDTAQVGAASEGTGMQVTLACFASGTRIATVRGEVAVEELREGDIAITRDGTAPVVWIGHRAVRCARHPHPSEVWPVRISRGAFAPGLPSRDLLLSPDHAVFADGLLIPVRYLVNGATIAREPVDRITYWHVELPAHGVLFADGLPVESYLDTGNRGAFANGGDVLQHTPDFALRIWDAQACARLAIGGPEVCATHAALLRRAASLGHQLTEVPDLRIAIDDGRVVRPTTDGGSYMFDLPPHIRHARLVSRSFVPAHLGVAGGDPRRLGVAVARLVLDDASVDLMRMKPGAGWHAHEGEGSPWRWTNGCATLDVSGGSRLRVELAMTGRYWAALPHFAAGRAAA